LLSSSEIKSKARALGFDACGIAPVGAFAELGFLEQWIDRGYAGDMGYLRRSARQRADVRNVVPSAKSVIVTATLYNVDRPYSTECADRQRAQIARYAWGEDYHAVIEARLEELLAWMRRVSPEPFEARRYVDTGPVQERVYAQHAGIGWTGKNTCVINPELGSWLFLGEIISSLSLDPDPPSPDQCGTCALCLEACPTEALRAPGVLDATRCISYLTIELRGSIPNGLRGSVGAHIFGCDVCQEVCPWNLDAPVSSDPNWRPRPVWDMKRIVELSRMSDDELGAALRGSAMRRAKIDGLRRNLAVALENTFVEDVQKTVRALSS